LPQPILLKKILAAAHHFSDRWGKEHRQTVKKYNKLLKVIGQIDSCLWVSSVYLLWLIRQIEAAVKATI